MNSEVKKVIAGIVIAAGESSRLGVPKQLIKWKDNTLIEFTIETINKAGIQPIHVVLGSHYQEIFEILKDLKIKVVLNANWREGKGSSIRIGVQSLPAGVDAAMIFVVDQPYLTTELIEKIVDEFQVNQYEIIAPVVNGIQTNPVLFDRSVFKDLEKLKGEHGARDLFNKYRYFQLICGNEKILFDIDQKSDLNRMYP